MTEPTHAGTWQQGYDEGYADACLLVLESRRTDPMTPEIRAPYSQILVDFVCSIEERRLLRTDLTWPDESDIYTTAIARLRSLEVP